MFAMLFCAYDPAEIQPSIAPWSSSLSNIILFYLIYLRYFILCSLISIPIAPVALWSSRSEDIAEDLWIFPFSRPKSTTQVDAQDSWQTQCQYLLRSKGGYCHSLFLLNLGNGLIAKWQLRSFDCLDSSWTIFGISFFLQVNRTGIHLWCLKFTSIKSRD